MTGIDNLLAILGGHVRGVCGADGDLAMQNVRQRFAELSTPIKIMKPEETKAFVENEEKLWWPFVRELDLK